MLRNWNQYTHHCCVLEELINQSHLSFQELQQKRAQKVLATQRLVEEEMAVMRDSKKSGRRKPGKAGSVKNTSPANSVIKANNAGEKYWEVMKLVGLDIT